MEGRGSPPTFSEGFYLFTADAGSYGGAGRAPVENSGRRYGISTLPAGDSAKGRGGRASTSWCLWCARQARRTAVKLKGGGRGAARGKKASLLVFLWSARSWAQEVSRVVGLGPDRKVKF
ncbi:hypothetical protein NDU88_005889 [Pleurodeles waltl]|uniref:Uncharacterized protein n=1 Tax=Pleurodeles waltl TaxID=8319 RepID=A0AAV7MCJ6_PLEWA|nr:hypothetical protein NDU88_005889 [Pleurodeles waltl]